MLNGVEANSRHERLHAIDEQFQALNLHLGAGKTVQDAAVPVFRLQQPAEEDAHHLAIAHHEAGILVAPGVGRVEERAHDDRAGR